MNEFTKNNRKVHKGFTLSVRIPISDRKVRYEKLKTKAIVRFA